MDLKKLIVDRLYIHKFNIGYNWLPSSMRNYDNDNYNDWNNNSTLKTLLIILLSPLTNTLI